MNLYNPHIILLISMTSLMTLGCNLLRPKSNNSAEGFSSKELDEDISAYAAHCRDELGFAGIDIPPLNCLDGVEVPVHIDGKTPSLEQYEALTKGNIGCDQPSWLEGVGCVNYNFVSFQKITSQVDLALICRSRNFSSPANLAERKAKYTQNPTLENFKSLYYFDSLGMIVTNNVTGKTCFFDQIDPVFGGFIPFPDRRHPPADSELPAPQPDTALRQNEIIVADVLQVTPTKTWKKPFQTARGDRCTVCHDNGPWKHSPWLPADLKIPSNSKNISYIPVGGPSFDYWRTSFEATAIDTAPVKITDDKTAPQLCTSCHRIGREATCKGMIHFAAGQKDPALVSNTGKNPKMRYWMPPITEQASALSDENFVTHWNDNYKPHYEALRRCCEDPRQDGCIQTKFGISR